MDLRDFFTDTLGIPETIAAAKAKQFVGLVGYSVEALNFGNNPAAANQDLWNNAVGREIDETATSRTQIGQDITTAIANGRLITNPSTDLRQHNYSDDAAGFIADEIYAIGYTLLETAQTLQNYFNDKIGDILAAVNTFATAFDNAVATSN